MSARPLSIPAFPFNPLNSPLPALAAWVISALGCSVSLLLTIQFIAGLKMATSSLSDELLGAAIGVVWEASKYLFIPLGLLFLSKNRFKTKIFGGGLVGLGGLLILGSVVASLGFLLEVDAKSTRFSAQKSPEYIAYSAKKDALVSQISVLTASASVDAENNFRGRSLSTLSLVWVLQLVVYVIKKCLLWF